MYWSKNKLKFVLLLFFASNILISSKQLLANSKGIAPPSKKKIALIIGNADYKGARLRNPIQDAKSIEDQLRDVGFEVKRLENSSLREMSEETREFGKKLRQVDVALYYYSGHGIQHNNTNWLLPVEADIRREQDIEFEAFNLNRLLVEMEGGTKNRVNIVIVDACRTPPTFRSFRNITNGLATPSTQPKGTIIAFSTAPGTVAHDGTGINSPYVAELIKYIKTPGMKIEDMFKQVRKGVVERTSKMSHPQVPWENSSLVGDFYFVEKKAANEDRTRWVEIRNSKDKRDFESFIREFPDSVYKEDAISSINELDREQINNQSSDDYYDISFRSIFGVYNVIDMKIGENLGVGLFHVLWNYEDEDTKVQENGYSIGLILSSWLDTFKQFKDNCYSCDGPSFGANFGTGRVDFGTLKGSKVETGVTVLGLGIFYQWMWPNRLSIVLGGTNVLRNFLILNESYVTDETENVKTHINRRIKSRSDFLPVILFGYSF